MKSSHLLCSIGFAALSPAPALAALGGDTASVQADRASMKGPLRVTPGIDYSVHEIQTSAGIVIREYASAQGQVFAVSWQGPGIPDLRQMFGSYYREFAQARTEPHYNHHHRAVRTAGVAGGAGGRTRGVFVRAT